jgi:hypothetical protein
MIFEIVKIVKYCHSLLGLHLSGNTGITNDTIETLCARMSATLCKP